jgi:predicted RNA-binding protein with PUA-like domain
MNYWLVKTEPGSYSIADLKRDKRVAWEGVRNYQARNFMRDMKVGELVLFYHSSAEVVGVYGVAKVEAAAHADASQFDKKDSHFDPKATAAKPIWECVDLGFVEQFKEPIPLGALRAEPALRGMLLLQQGSRLSVMPVSEREFKHIRELAAK